MNVVPLPAEPAPLTIPANFRDTNVEKKGGLHWRPEVQTLIKEETDRTLPLWRANAEANRPAWEKGRKLDALLAERAPGHAGGACVVCAPGPSIGNEFSTMVELRDRITVVAVDSALHPLKLAGIFPDYVFVRNADPVTVELLGKYPRGKSVFLLPVWAAPELVERVGDDAVFYLPWDEYPPFDDWARTLPPLPRILFKPSTATMAFQFANALGFGLLNLAGFDFAFTYGRLYCDLTKYLLHPGMAEAAQAESDPHARPYKIEDMFFEMTWTNIRLHMSAEDLLRAIKCERMEHVHNASLGILYNVKWMPLKFSIVDYGKVIERTRTTSITFHTDKLVRLSNELTVNAFTPLMSRNMIVNHERGWVRRSISELFARRSEFARRVAVVAGAAASLDDNLDAMRKHRAKYYLVATDAALGPLLDAGIRPDLTLNIDPDRRATRFFHDVDTSGLTLMTTVTGHPEMVGTWKGEIIWGFSLATSYHFMNLAMLYPHVGVLITLGNCGSTSILICLQLGFESVVFAGVDFAYTHDRYYCANARLDMPAGRDAVRALLEDKSKYFEKTDVRGESVVTAHSLYHYVNSSKQAFDGVKNLYNAGAGLLDTIPVVDFDKFFRNRRA